MSNSWRKATAIPTMNIFTIKPDMDGNPNRAKSSIVVLGNLEQQIWSQEDKYTPILSSNVFQLLVSMAVSDGHYLKQVDCKNAFCNGILPEDESCIVNHPLVIRDPLQVLSGSSTKSYTASLDLLTTGILRY